MMARVLFLMRYPMHEPDNLTAKFDGQMAAMRELGHEVYFIGWDKQAMWLCGGETPICLIKTRLSNVPTYYHTLCYRNLMTAWMRAMKIMRFDAVYIRYLQTFDNAVRAIKMAHQQGSKVIVEHPTYPFSNGKTSSWIRKPIFRYTGYIFERMQPYIDAYALIGEDAGGSLSGIPAINIVNGVDADAYPLHVARQNATDLHLIGVASMSHWQGYDRLIRSLSAYEGEMDIHLHLVGGDGDGSLPVWQALAQSEGLADRVHFHGEMHGKALDDLFAICDIGVGGLGLYRKNQFQSMTLKLREYMARGLPFVYAVDDPSIPDPSPFCMRVSNDERIFAMESIVDFAVQAKENKEIQSQMRAYAKAHLSWTPSMRKVLEMVGIS